MEYIVIGICLIAIVAIGARIHFIPGLINDEWNFRSISERTAGMIDSQVGGHSELHHDNSDLYVEDVQLISKDGKVYYLPSRKK